MKQRSLLLKYKYNFSDLLSWVYHNNRTFFDVLISRTPPRRVLQELHADFYHERYRNVLFKAAGLPETHESDQSKVNRSFAVVASQCHYNLDSHTMDWYHQRGVTDEQVERHKLGTSRGYNPLKAIVDGGLPHCCFYSPLCGMDEVVKHFDKSEMIFATIPFFDATGVSNMACRVLDDDFTEVLKFFFSHGPTALFNLDKADTSKPFYVFEGVFDTLAAERYNIPSVALGCSSVSEEQDNLLRPFRDRAILCLDGDVAGRNGMEKSSLRKFHLPDGGDPEDFLNRDPSFAEILRQHLV